jgi:hypothetical protein
MVQTTTNTTNRMKTKMFKNDFKKIFSAKIVKKKLRFSRQTRIQRQSNVEEEKSFKKSLFLVF